ncbi:hypothetical protein F1559_004935 [Cyanidiococcus yangmingshanensis]|uniref:Uncharacterized protein n=1 Tax=Cyanidiococcus yangmingshanensis TaxID=2690220 RepID=A0A7J7INE8_9RHOD|nr:hypothetical protein F1559_004935 [Cyanidiococcus yangmingshanensis]
MGTCELVVVCLLGTLEKHAAMDRDPLSQTTHLCAVLLSLVLHPFGIFPLNKSTRACRRLERGERVNVTELKRKSKVNNFSIIVLDRACRVAVPILAKPASEK